MERLLDSQDVAMLLGVQPSAVSNWKKRGTGPLPEADFTTGNHPYWKPATIAPLAKAEREKVLTRLNRMKRAAEILL